MSRNNSPDTAGIEALVEQVGLEMRRHKLWLGIGVEADTQGQTWTHVGLYEARGKLATITCFDVTGSQADLTPSELYKCLGAGVLTEVVTPIRMILHQIYDQGGYPLTASHLEALPRIDQFSA